MPRQDSIGAVRDLALATFGDSAQPAVYHHGFANDPFLVELMAVGTRTPSAVQLDDLISALRADSTLAAVPDDGPFGVMIHTPRGGVRSPIIQNVAAVFGAARMQMLVRSEPPTASLYADWVVKGFEQFLSALKSGRTVVCDVRGLGGLQLRGEAPVATPWGIVLPVPALPPEARSEASHGEPSATALLVSEQEVPVTVDAAAEGVPVSPERDDLERRARMELLLPLAFALGAGVAPAFLWNTTIVPFLAVFGYGRPLQAAISAHVSLDVDDEQSAAVSDWSGIIEASHRTPIDVAARRTVSSLIARADRSDVLIDAIIAWENLVGASPETTFRVTASLAKLIEGDPTKRADLRKQLATAYGTRSRVVHGVAVDPPKVHAAAELAVKVAIEALKASYRRGADWLELSSSDRADRLLLEEP